MKIQVLGTGCSKCTKTFENAEQAVRELGTCADLEKVEDLKAIMSFGVMVTPALVIDGQVKMVGRIPSVEEIKSLVSDKA